MTVHLSYNGQTWQLAEDSDAQDCQQKVLTLNADGGGFAEFELPDGKTLAVLVGPAVPVAFVDSSKEPTYFRLPR